MGRWLASDAEKPLHFLSAAASTPPEHVTPICEIAAHPRRYVGKQVEVVGDLTDIEPHGVILAAGKGSHCVLEVGDVSHGTATDVLSVIHGAPREGKGPISMVAHVSVRGVVRSQHSTDFYGRPYDAYVLDEMVIRYRTKGR